MDRFWDLLQQSVIVQGLVTLALVGVTVYLYVTGQPIPDTLLNFDYLVLGFFFSSKIVAAVWRWLQGSHDATRREP